MVAIADAFRLIIRITAEFLHDRTQSTFRARARA